MEFDQQTDSLDICIKCGHEERHHFESPNRGQKIDGCDASIGRGRHCKCEGFL